MFFIYGGRTRSTRENEDTNTVWQGIINPETGAITWEESTTGGNAVIPDNRNSHGAVEFNSTIYLIGGRSGGTIDRSGYASYIDPDNLRLFREGALNFFKDDFGALPVPANPGRRDAGVVLVPTSNPSYAFAYLIGGTDGSVIRSEVFRATIGQSTDQTFYPPTGYYYSKPFPIRELIGEERGAVRSITWLTSIDPANGGDIQVEYRVYSPSSGNCADTSAAASVGWTLARDPNAGEGRFSKLNPDNAAYAINTQEYQNQSPGACFQYRLIFRRGAVQSASPVLLRMGMELVVPGNPDLNWPADAVTITQNADNTTRGVEVRLRNENLTDSGPTQPANVCHALQPECDPEGTFFVDVFIFPPGVTPISPTLPLLEPDGKRLSSSNETLAPYHRACLQIPKRVMAKNVTYRIEENTRWSDIKTVGIDGCVSAATNASNGTGKILRDFFDQGNGTYKVILVADTHTDLRGLVYESDVPDGDHVAERNNVSAIFDVPFVAASTPTPTGTPTPTPTGTPTPTPTGTPTPDDGTRRVFLPLVTR